MAVFSNFSDLLPDPVFKINTAGATFSDASNTTLVSDGVAGPGFAKIKFASNNQTQVSRTISGRGVTASPSYHNWSFDINYNPMTRDEFEPVSTFLEGRRGRLNPFYVILPQHAKPRDSAFASYISTRSVFTGWLVRIASYSATGTQVTLNFSTTASIPHFNAGDTISVTINDFSNSLIEGARTVVSSTTTSVTFASTATAIGTTAVADGFARSFSNYPAGSTSLPIRIAIGTSSSASPANFVGEPNPGDFFNILDSNDTNHKKVYKVIAVETDTTYQSGTVLLNSQQRRIHFVPPLARTTSSNARIVFINPKFRVIQKGDTLEYDLDTDNLYQFSLSLEEIQP